MRIALVLFADFEGGGAPSRRVNLIGKGLVALGHEVHIVIPQKFHPGPLLEEKDGLTIHWGMLTNTHSWNRVTARLASRLETIKLIARLATQGLDWLLLSNPSLDGLPLLYAAGRRGARVIAMYDDIRDIARHPTLEDRARWIWMRAGDALIPRLTQLNLVISSFLEHKVLAVAPRTPLLVLPPLVDTELFQAQSGKAAAFRAKWALGDETVISYLGTYWHLEGVAVLLQAAKQLVQSGRKFKLVISGASFKGLDCDDVPGLIQELGLKDVVVQTGWLPTEEVIAGMSAADVLVVPKVNHLVNVAGIPTKLAEYLAMGKPVVVSRIGDIPNFLTDHEDALLCEPGIPNSLANVLDRLICDLPLREKLAANARSSANRHFDYHQAVTHLEAAMHRVSAQTKLANSV